MFQIKGMFLKLLIVLLLMVIQVNAKQFNSDWSNLSQEQYVDKLVECKITIDELKWSYNLWPKGNKTAKPPFSDVLDIDQIRQSVYKTLKMQAVLSDKFNFEITPAMLQHDLDRMASNTKDAKRLKELFAVLNNDATTIVQCVSRPYLVQKKLANQYDNNNQIHAPVKLIAQTELDTYLQSYNTEDTTAQVHTVTFKLMEENKQDIEIQGPDQGMIIELEAEEFKQKLKQLNNSKLQETQYAFIYTEVLEQTHQSIKVQVLQWQKQNQRTWLETQENTEYSQRQIYTQYSLPTITAQAKQFDNRAITQDTWKAPNLPSARSKHTAIWTGTEMIVWGGYDGNSYLNTGSRYDPISDSWVAISTNGAPDTRSSHTTIWTGSEMIIWGGYGADYLNTGSRYHSASNTWNSISTNGAPDARSNHTAIWAESKMIIWGGWGADPGLVRFNTGSRYDPNSDSWVATSNIDAPSERNGHRAIWTGSEMIIWAGATNSGHTNTGGRYNPSSNNWFATSTIDAPVSAQTPSYSPAIWSGSEMIIWSGFYLKGSRYDPINNSWIDINTTDAPSNNLGSAIWTGSEMIIWGGSNGNESNTGGRYDPISDSWLSTDTSSAPSQRVDHDAIWTGTEMIVWGGQEGSDYLNTGGRYNPVNDSWVATSTGDTPSGARIDHTVIWSGNEMIVWGGFYSDGASGFFLSTGGRYNPVSDNWLATSTSGAPLARVDHTAIWTGQQMIIWGGNFSSIYLNTGSHYSPLPDSWEATNTTGAPSARSKHTAVWANNRMIIWGGYNGVDFLNSGGNYFVNNGWGWHPTNTSGAPSGRYRHSAISTGNEMIIWGGFPEFGFTNSGGRYNPVSNNWIATSTSGAPSARHNPTAIWTGSEMIIWGGHDLFDLNTGGRFNPNSNSWIATSTSDAPSARRSHTAIWTDSEMIIWGGNDGDYLNTGGRYDPSDGVNGSWLATSTIGVPDIRENHTAIWTDREMIVWGGYDGVDYLNSIGLYYPNTAFLVGGNVTGMHPGNPNTMLLFNDTNDDILTIYGNGAFVFATPLLDSQEYEVEVESQPDSPVQTCSVVAGIGTITGNDIDTVQINCGFGNDLIFREGFE